VRLDQGLSERRESRRCRRTRRVGVPQNASDMQVHGHTHLPVPAGPGVRELQNRPIEILYH
jgi:OmpA-OmpF porin, OOP family